VMAMMYGSLSGGESAWYAADGNIKVSQELRSGVMRIGQELRKSSDEQVIVLNNTGVNGTM